MKKGLNTDIDEIVVKIIEAIHTTAHDYRRILLEEAFYMSLRNNFLNWALLCRGFILLLENKQVFINTKLWNNLEDVSQDHNFNSLFWNLRTLLFAQAYRYRASSEMYNYEKNIYEDADKLKKRIYVELSDSEKLYNELIIAKINKHIKMVALYGLARLEFIKMELKKREQKDRQIRFKYSNELLKTKQFYNQSIIIARGLGLIYSAPILGNVLLDWIVYIEENNNWGINKKKKHLEECLKSLDVVIKADKQKHAYPLLLKARIQHTLQIRCSKSQSIKNTVELISKAVERFPFDNAVQSELEDFADAIKRDYCDSIPNIELYHQIRFVQPAKSTKASINKYLRSESKINGSNNSRQLLIMRRWSSYTPLIKLQEHNTRGGGYLLEWDGTRVVIDPGVGFLRNIFEYGYRIQDLDAVIVTHQHIDHVDDMEAILSLLKTYNSIQSVKSKNKYPRFFLSDSGNERWEKIIIGALNLDSSKKNVEVLKPNQKCSSEINGIKIIPVPLHYHQDALDEVPELDSKGHPIKEEGREPTGFGLIFEIPLNKKQKCTIGISSDTGYVSRDKKVSSEYFQNCDIVVLHLSNVDDLDYLNKFDKSKFVKHPWKDGEPYGYKNVLYKKHLGFWGVVEFIKDLISENGRSNRTIILSEFGEETLKNRVAILNELCKIIEKLGKEGEKQSRRIYLGDIGTQVRLPEGAIGCHFGFNRCNAVADSFLEFDGSDNNQKFTNNVWNDRSIVHFCQSHGSMISKKNSPDPALWGYLGIPIVNNIEHDEARNRYKK